MFEIPTGATATIENESAIFMGNTNTFDSIHLSGIVHFTRPLKVTCLVRDPVLRRLAMSDSKLQDSTQSHSRTVRFKKKELKEIEEFLRLNPMFDFSSLARMAIQSFVRDPKVRIKAVSKDKAKWN